MAEGDKERELIELRTELATVVEVLGVLHDFVESVFGTKYQNFMTNSCSQLEGCRNDGGNNYTTHVQSALKRLRWKHSKCDMEDDRAISTPPSRGVSGESKGDNGYSSGGTPTPVTTLGDDRRDSVSSQNNQMLSLSPTAEGMRAIEDECKMEGRNACKFSLSVGRPEVVAVKCEVDETDFLDDVDPFGSEQGDYPYEDSDLKIDDCYPVAHTNPINSEDNQNQEAKTFGDPHTNSSPRFIPELIPIQSDPLLQNLTSLNSLKDEESGTSSSDNSDVEWHPSSFSSTSSKRQKNDTKRKFLAKPKRSNQQDRIAFNNFSENNYGSTNIASQPTRSQPSSSLSNAPAVSGPFKCDMCPASYKQEESLRSHQKYKHNPSRVQCTCHLCGKSMVDKYRLQRHLRLHTGEKPFECEYCGQSFYRKDYHTKHLQRKHGISYTTGPPSKIVRKPILKSKASILSSPSSSLTVSSISTSTAFSSSFQSLRSDALESSPLTVASLSRKPIMASSIAGRDRHDIPFITTASPSSLSTSPATTSLSTCSNNIVNNSSNNHPSVQNKVASGSGWDLNGSEYFSSIGNLMTMTSLTFDDLISADF